MKIKNPYITLTIVWTIFTIIGIIVTATFFLEGSPIVGVFFLIVTSAVAFSSGFLLGEAIKVYNHNKACEFLEDISDFLHEQIAEQIEPFEELSKGENDGQ